MTERKFYGKLNNFTSKQERNQEKNHLNAYIHGRTFYQYGYTELVTGGRVPAYHPVLTAYEN